MICQVCFPCFAGQCVSFLVCAEISVVRCTHQHLSFDRFLEEVHPALRLLESILYRHVDTT